MVPQELTGPGETSHGREGTYIFFFFMAHQELVNPKENSQGRRKAAFLSWHIGAWPVLGMPATEEGTELG